MGSQHSRHSSTSAPPDNEDPSSDTHTSSEEDPSLSSFGNNNINSPAKCLQFLPCDDDWPWVWALRDGRQLDWRKACPTPELVQERMLEQLHLPVDITSKVYLGDAACIANITRLQELGITAVLNVARRDTLSAATLQALEDAGMEYVHIATLDKVDYPLLAQHWQELYETLRRLTHGRGRRCVVHCHAGQNRAALVVAAYTMVTTKHTTVLETVRLVRRQRGNCALQNVGFQEQLVALARTLQVLGPAPGMPGCIVTERPPTTRPQAWIVPPPCNAAEEEDTPNSWRSKAWQEIRQVTLRGRSKAAGAAT